MLGLSLVPMLWAQPHVHHALSFSNTAGLPVPSEGEEGSVAAGRKEISPGPAAGSRESLVTCEMGSSSLVTWRWQSQSGVLSH